MLRTLRNAERGTNSRRIQSSPRHRALAAACEPLETRRLLSTINWTNQGTGAGAGDTDDFNAMYGGNAALARNIVQRAIDDWERVIVDFNYQGGGNTYSVDITAAPISGRGGTGGITQLGGKPTSADIQMDDNGGGNGWYFDPTIGSSTLPDDGEFINPASPWESSFTGVGGAADDNDFYRTIVHELGHAMGIAGSSGSSLLLDDNFTDIGDDPNSSDPTDRLFAWNINGGAVEATFTNNTGTHFYEVSVPAGNPTHPNDLLNPGRTVGGPPTTRQLISDLNATVLRDAYNYTINLPSTINTFYANLNTGTNVLTINGDLAINNNDADNIDLEGNGASFEVEANGTSEFIPSAQFTSIVLNAGLDVDNIDVNALPSGKTVTINLGNDTGDRCDIAQDTDDIDTNLLSDLTVNGGTTGTDTLTFNDGLDGPNADTYTFTASTAAKSGTVVTYGGIESFAVAGSNQPSTYNVNGLSSITSLSITAGTGADVFNIANGDFDNNILGDLTINGGGGVDSATISDVDDTGADDYNFIANRFEKIATAGRAFFANGTENVAVLGSDNNHDWFVPQVSSFLDLTLTGGTGIDALNALNNNFDVNLTSRLVFNGGGGTSDSATIADASSAGLNYTFDFNSLDKGSTGIFEYHTIESFLLNCNAGNNVINVLSTFSSCPPTVNGNSGDDTINVNDGTSALFNMGSDITFNGGSGTSDDVNISDETFAGAGNFTITNGHVILPFNSADVFFATTENLLVVGSDGANTVNVDQTNILTIISGEDGVDTINVGNGDFDNNITANVLVVGGDGSDVAIIDDTLDPGNNTWTITNSSVAKDTATGELLTNFFGPTIEAVRIDAGGGNSNFNINSMGSSTSPVNHTINCGGGDDRVTVGDGVINDLFGAIVVNGQAGTNDSMVVNDNLDAGVDTYTVTNALIGKSDWVFNVTYSTIDNLAVLANDAASTINVTATNLATQYLMRGNGGADVFNISNSNVAVVLDGGLSLDTANVNTDGVGTAQARFSQNQDFQAINIGTGGTLFLDAGGLRIDTQGTNIAGRLDLSDGGFIDRTPAAEAVYRTLLNSGFNGGAWNGTQPAITSVAAASAVGNDALGYAFAGEAGLGSFFGTPVGANDFLIRYTLYGDANLTGNVNINDFALLAANFNTPANWVRGNFNYDAINNVGDFSLLAANFNQSVADVPAARGGTSPAGGLFGTAKIGGGDVIDELQEQLPA